jgi:hypothetical protein
MSSDDPRFLTRNGDPVPQKWERWPSESNRAWEAFELFRSMGHARRLTRVGETLSKSRQLISRWASRYRWQDRAAAFDAFEAREINERVILARAKLREGLTEQALDAVDLPALSLEDKQGLSVAERAMLLRTAASIAEGDQLETPHGFAADPRFHADTPPIPQFVIQVIRSGVAPDGSRMVGVQIPGDPPRYGYIPESRCDKAAADHPDWVFIR